MYMTAGKDKEKSVSRGQHLQNASRGQKNSAKKKSDFTIYTA